MEHWNGIPGDLGQIDPDATLREAARRMRVLDIAALPVCENDEFVGVVTAEDIAFRAVADGCDPNGTRVRDVMTWQMFFFDAMAG